MSGYVVKHPKLYQIIEDLMKGKGVQDAAEIRALIVSDGEYDGNWELAEALGVTTHINEWGGVGMYGFEVCLGLPMVDCIGAPVDYTDWYLEHVRYE